MTKEEFFWGSDPNDLETQRLLEDSWNNRIEIEELNNLLSGKSYNSFDSIRINPSKPEEFRSKFHDFNNTPHGISYLTNDPISIFPYTGRKENGEKGYEYYADILLCENGSDVYHQYKTHSLEPHHLYFFYEKPDKSKMNFFGSFYAVRMGEYFKTLFSRKDLNLPSKINGKPFLEIKNLKDEAKYISQLTYTYDKNIVNPTSVYYALQREFDFLTGGNILGEIMGDVLSIPKEALSWCNDKLEEIKPKEKNYNADDKDFSPLLPIITPAGIMPVPVNVNTAAQFFENLGNNPFVQGAEAVFSEVWQVVTTAAAKVKDAVIEHLPDALKPLVTKISNVINFLKSFVQVLKDDATAMAENGLEFLKILNAFNCGIISGIISLVQCLLMLLELLLSPTKDYSYQQFLEKRDLQEKIEDVVDWLVINVPVFLNGINDLRTSSIGVSDLQNAFDAMGAYFGKISRYTAAFYVGIVAFEVIINILLLIFTEGAGNVVKGATYVQKAVSLLKVLARETVSVVTVGITDLLAFLGRFVVRFAKACAKGFRGFIKFVEELLQGTKNGAKAEDLAEDAKDLEEVILKGKKPRSIYEIGRDVRFGLEKLGIEIKARADGFLLKWKEKPIFKGGFKEISDFWRKILKPKLGTGSGGVLKYLEVLSRNMVAQEHSMSCAAACIRQLAKDHGIEMAESAIRKLAGTTEELGTTDLGMVLALEDVFKGKKVEALSYFKNTDEVMPDILRDISEDGSWLTSIHPLNGQKHAVIVDKIIDSKVYIRDPFPIEGIGKGNGVEAIVSLEDFVYSWVKAGANKYKVK